MSAEHPFQQPLDEGAYSGDTFCLIAQDHTPHCGRWDEGRRLFVYAPASDGSVGHMLCAAAAPIPKQIVGYIPRRRRSGAAR